MVDLLDLLADSVGFSYRLVPVYDGQYGLLKGDGGWNGMVGELLREVGRLSVDHNALLS